MMIGRRDKPSCPGRPTAFIRLREIVFTPKRLCDIGQFHFFPNQSVVLFSSRYCVFVMITRCSSSRLFFFHIACNGGGGGDVGDRRLLV